MLLKWSLQAGIMTGTTLTVLAQAEQAIDSAEDNGCFVIEQ